MGIKSHTVERSRRKSIKVGRRGEDPAKGDVEERKKGR